METGKRAADLLDKVQADPHRVLEEGRVVVDESRLRSRRADAAVALRAMGLAARLVDTLPHSIELLRQSVDEAELTRDPALQVESIISLSGSLAMSGDNEQALDLLGQAAVLTPSDDAALRARIDFQKGTILARQASPAAAIEHLSSALESYRRSDDLPRVALTLRNLGNVYTFGGDLDAAADAYSEARELYSSLDRPLERASVLYNLGTLAMARGDLPEAVALFDEHERARRELIGGTVEPHLGAAEALLASGLFTEAQRLAAAWRAELRSKGFGADEAEAALLEAQAALLAGDRQSALEAVIEAMRLVEDQQRVGWMAHARLLRLRTVAPDMDAERRAAEGREIATQLEAAGQFIPAANAWLVAGRAALELGDVVGASEDLGRLDRYRNAGPIELRVQAWLAATLLRRARDDRRGADAAARAGLRTLSSYQAALGATDVRVGVAQFAAELSQVGFGLALEDGRPRRIWEWMERTRAGAARLRPVVAPMDDDLRTELADLRRVTAELRTADGDAAVRLSKRQAQLQEAIRHRSRVLAGAGPDRQARGSLYPLVRERLAGTTLIEMAEHDGELLAVTVTGRTTVHRLGTAGDVDFELSSLRATMRRVATRGLDDTAWRTVAHAGARLAELLLPPDIDGERVVIVPPATLHAVPWALLPGLRGRTVSVAPSAELWLQACERSGEGAGAVLAAGPDLVHADAEVDDVSELYPGGLRFASADSRVADVLGAINGAHIAHIACHGTFQPESPMFSALQLADGDLVAYDIERLEAAPAVVVLSSCDAGLSAARPGDELMGLASALLSVGTSSLIASTGLVPDTDATRSFVHRFHEEVLSGAVPAAALATAQASVAGDPEAALAAASFVCFGS